MKQKIKRVFFNMILYFILLLGLILLYSPFRDDPHNKPKTNIQFVYQQF